MGFPTQPPVLYRSPSPLVTLDEFSLSGQEEQIYMSFFNHKPIIGHYMQSNILMYLDRGSNSPASEDTALRLSIQSLITAYYGRVHHQAKISVRARQLYGRALEKLALELNQSNRASHEPLMSAIVALTIYEMLTYQHTQGWVQHAGGLAQLLKVGIHFIRYWALSYF